MQDLILAAITSQGAEDSAFTIDQQDCVDGILPKKSILKPAKLFTMQPPGQGCLPLVTAITFPGPTRATAGRSLPLHGGHPTEPPRPASSPSTKIRASQ